MRLLRFVALRSRRGAYGGPADTALNQARLAAAHGHDVTLFSATLEGDEPQGAGDSPVQEVTARARVLIPRLGFFSLFSARALKTAWILLRDTDLIHISYCREALPLAVALMSVMRGVPMVLQPHGMLTARRGPRQRTLDVIARPIFRRAGSVIALTENERAELESWCPRFRGVMHVVGNPSLRLPDGVKAVSVTNEALFIARLEPRKRVEDFVAAAEVSADRRRPVRYVIVGPDQGDWEKIATRVRACGSLTYEGAIPSESVPRRLARAGVFVLPSWKEPWGNVLVTALSLGVPVVVPKSAALSSTIAAYGAGAVVNDGAPDEIATAVERLLFDPEARARARQGALDLYAEKLGDEAVWASLRTVYDENFAQHPAKR
ncbi:glycosyltransferase family 4 protein [Microbacterium sp. NPDC096154]|uniref:glycosyltransferase family 4 protein n=1 Tax=Microbacterium sp. NPDC096154 TaxID=3155549 RepID=UPI003331A8D6